MLDQIVKVKQFRLESAKKELAAAKQNLVQANEALDAHLKSIEEYTDFMRSEKVRLFKTIENEQINLKELDGYQLEISIMKQHLAGMHSKTSEFEADITKAEERLAESRERYQKCNIDVQKFEEVGLEVKESDRLRAEYKEEVEFEDRVHKGFKL